MAPGCVRYPFSNIFYNKNNIYSMYEDVFCQATCLHALTPKCKNLFAPSRSPPPPPPSPSPPLPPTHLFFSSPHLSPLLFLLFPPMSNGGIKMIGGCRWPRLLGASFSFLFRSFLSFFFSSPYLLLALSILLLLYTFIFYYSSSSSIHHPFIIHSSSIQIVERG